jgi:hypothetical protein
METDDFFFKAGAHTILGLHPLGYCEIVDAEVAAG